MKKTILILSVLAVFAAALGFSVSAYAQAPTPNNPAAPASGFGSKGSRGGSRMGAAGTGIAAGVLHDDMVASIAEKLGMTVEALNTRLNAGDTMGQIADEKGLTLSEFRTLMLEARSQAIDKAVAAGTLTQAQADRMKQTGAGVSAGGMGRGMGQGMRGNGQGQFSNPACPYYTPTAP
jgi:hypothetical protein